MKDYNSKEMTNIFETKHKMVKGTWSAPAKRTFGPGSPTGTGTGVAPAKRTQLTTVHAVEHENPEPAVEPEVETEVAEPAVFEKPEKPERKLRPAKAERPERPERPVRPERPERPERPAREARPPMDEAERRRRAAIKAKKRQRQKFNKKLYIAIAILAFLDIFFLFPAMHSNAALESGTARIYKLADKSEGLTIINGKTYYFDKRGRMTTGPATIDGKEYYFDDRMGYMKTGVVKLDGDFYFYDKQGQRQTGAITYNDNQYYFGEDGKMHTGWLEKDGNTYYYDKDGKKLFGMQEIDGKKCMFVGSDGIYKDISVKPDQPMIALTFDDGPADGTSEVLDALEAVGGRATFFVVGYRVESYPEDMKRAVEMGCEIGNHSWDHTYLDGLDENGVLNQINQTNDSVEAVTGVRPKLMRLPGGRENATVDACIRQVGMPMINWSVDTLDWSTLNTGSTIEAAVNGAYDGAIILMHDLHASTTAGAAQIVNSLSSMGYQLVTVSEMAQARGITLTTDAQYYDFQPTKPAASETEAGASSAESDGAAADGEEAPQG